MTTLSEASMMPPITEDTRPHRVASTSHQPLASRGHAAFRRRHSDDALAAFDAATARGETDDDAADAFLTERLRATVQAQAEFWGPGHGRTPQAEYAAQLMTAAIALIREAVTAAPRDGVDHSFATAAALHEAVDHAAADDLRSHHRGYTKAAAYRRMSYNTAVSAMPRALNGSPDEYAPSLKAHLRAAIKGSATA